MMHCISQLVLYYNVHAWFEVAKKFNWCACNFTHDTRICNHETRETESQAGFQELVMQYHPIDKYLITCRLRVFG